jgi:hypothetical protein
MIRHAVLLEWKQEATPEQKAEAAGYVSYRDHPRHQEIVAKYIAPIRAKGVAVQFEF